MHVHIHKKAHVHIKFHIYIEVNKHKITKYLISVAVNVMEGEQTTIFFRVIYITFGRKSNRTESRSNPIKANL